MRIWPLVVLAGCGRLEFDPLVDASAVVEDDAFINLCTHTFCDDFDRLPPVPTGWDGQFGTGGVISLVTDQYVSDPQSLLVDVPTGSTAGVYLHKILPQAVTHARISVDLSYATANAGIAEMDLVKLRWLTPPAPCTQFGYFLVRDSTGPFVMQETYTACGGNTSTPLVLSGAGFHRIVVDVFFGPMGTARVTVQIDGMMMFNELPAREIPSSGLELLLGSPSQRDVIAPWQIRYDNLLVDIE